MRVGIDAKSFFNGPVSTRVVLQNLLPELIKLFPEIEWFIFLNKKDHALGFPFKAPNIHIVYVWAEMNMLSNIFVLPGFVRKLKLDVIFNQTFPTITKGTASVALIHDVLFRDFPQFFTWKERWYFVPLPYFTRKASRLIATTGFVAKDLVRYNYTRDRSSIDIAPLGVSPVYAPKELHDPSLLEKVKADLKLPDRFILFVGRLNVRKNLENLLLAMPLIEDKNIPLVVVGKEDWKAPELKNIISNASIGTRVIMTGSIGDHELKAVYAMATIFCFPSYAEGFGLPPLEAMASGVPVIVSATTSLPDVCGNAAVYADPKSPASLASSIDTLLNDKELYKEKRALGMQRAQQFSWQNSARAFMQSIRNAYDASR